SSKGVVQIEFVAIIYVDFGNGNFSQEIQNVRSSSAQTDYGYFLCKQPCHRSPDTGASCRHVWIAKDLPGGCHHGSASSVASRIAGQIDNLRFVPDHSYVCPDLFIDICVRRLVSSLP